MSRVPPSFVDPTDPLPTDNTINSTSIDPIDEMFTQQPKPQSPTTALPNEISSSSSSAAAAPTAADMNSFWNDAMFDGMVGDGDGEDDSAAGFGMIGEGGQGDLFGDQGVGWRGW